MNSLLFAVLSRIQLHLMPSSALCLEFRIKGVESHGSRSPGVLQVMLVLGLGCDLAFSLAGASACCTSLSETLVTVLAYDLIVLGLLEAHYLIIRDIVPLQLVR
jgi:hypothetical protein